MAASVALAAADLAVLSMERTSSDLNIGLVLLLDRDPDDAELEQRLTAQLARFSRLRCRLADGRQPLFVEDVDFALKRHLRRLPSLASATHAGAGPDEAKERLLAAVAAAFAEPLERDHPLWRIDVIGHSPGAHGPAAAALCLVMHHALSDGIGMAELLRALVRDDRSAVDRREPPEGASTTRLGGGGLVRLARQMAVDLIRPFRRSALTGCLGARRQFTAWELPRDSLRRICRLSDCSLATVLLAITSGALRRYERAHGYATSRDLSVFLPMSTRARGERWALGNRFVTFRVPLAVPLASPGGRLERCRAEMQKVASLYPLRMSERVARHSARLPRSWQRLLAQSPGRLTNLVFTLLPVDVDGANLCGARVLACYGAPALLGTQGAGLAFIVGKKAVHGQIVSDPQVVSDPHRLREAFFDSFAELLDFPGGER